MINAVLDRRPYPAAIEIIASEMPKAKDYIYLEGHGTFMVRALVKRWENDYIYLENLYGWKIEGYLKISVKCQ